MEQTRFRPRSFAIPGRQRLFWQDFGCKNRANSPELTGPAIAAAPVCSALTNRDVVAAIGNKYGGCEIQRGNADRNTATPAPSRSRFS
jgi:hypothetical protein